MSIDRSYYVIAGYDLTDLKTSKYRDWKWTDDGEMFLCNQVKGNIQLFDDPMSGSYLYLGFVLAAGDEFYFKTTKFDVTDVHAAFDDVSWALSKLQHAGVVAKDPNHVPVFQIIVFEECS